MKNTMKRIFAICLMLAMCLGMLPAVALSPQAAAVDYVYAGEYIKNWGTRGTDATFLSPNAESFYAENGTSYAALSALSGASDTSSVPSSPLYLQLHELMYGQLTDYTTYDETKELFQYTDCQNSGKTSSKISSFYSGTSIGPAWDSGATWNREHVWPNSKSAGGSNNNSRRETDIMMLRPTSISENSSRGNAAYGESSSYYDPNELSGGTYDLRGDAARTVLYVYVCWGGDSTYSDGALDYMWGSSGVIESKEILLKWMEEDPVDTWEMGRNDSVESITGTRNVFIDYPELAFCLFNEDVPTDYTSPSGQGADVSYSITAVSNNAAWGSVTVSGKSINATPATGYEVAGYQLLSGSAEIARNGNVFTVTPASDVKVQINFTARTQNTVSFSQFGIVASTVTAYAGDVVTLPGHTGEMHEGYTFMGWVENVVEKTETLPSFYPAGGNYTVTRDVNLFALYAITENDGTGSGNVFAPYSGALTEGDYLIVYEDCAMVAALTDKKRLQYVSVTYAGTDIVSPAENTIWHLAPVDGYWTMYNAATGKYAGGSGAKNVAALLDTVTEFAKWSETVEGDTYEFLNKGNDEKGVSALLRKNNTVGFACYALNTTAGGPLSLYKRGESGTTYYLTGNLVVTDQSGNAYETLAAALENAAQGSKLTLLKSVDEDVTVSKDITLDLCGFCVNGTVTVASGCTLYGMDAQTDDFTVEDEYGYGRIAEVICQGTGSVTGLKEESDLAQCGYLMVTETEGVSFHCVNLQMVSMSLRTTQAGVYYKSEFAGDELVAKNVQQFGVAMSIVAAPEAATMDVHCGYSEFFAFTAGSNNSEATSTLLKGIMKKTNETDTNERNANTVVYGRAYVLTKDGQYLFGATAQRTLRQQTEAADTRWEQMSDSQKDGLRQMYTEYEAVMQAWYLPNLKGTLEGETPDTPTQTGYVKVTSADQLTDGQYVLVLDAGYAPGVYDGTTSWVTAVQPTVADDVIATPEGCVWTLDFTDGSVTLTDENGVSIAPKGGNNNGIKTGDYQWTWSFTDGKVTFAGTGSDTVLLAANKSSDYKFRGYKNSTATGNPTSYPYEFTLYKNNT